MNVPKIVLPPLPPMPEIDERDYDSDTGVFNARGQAKHRATMTAYLYNSVRAVIRQAIDMEGPSGRPPAEIVAFGIRQYEGMLEAVGYADPRDLELFMATARLAAAEEAAGISGQPPFQEIPGG